jgi:hypothetical protein
MGFLAPWFLAGAAVTALPLWLHLLRRYRSEPQPFSSLMFFEPRTQSSVRHRRCVISFFWPYAWGCFCCWRLRSRIRL